MPLRAALLALAFLALPAGAATAATVGRALVVLVPSGTPPGSAGVSAGIMSGTQGACAPAQMALDASAGSRVGCVEYDRPLTTFNALSGRVGGWQSLASRAGAAPQLLIPGLLAQETGGAAYAAPSTGPHVGALLAADRAGRIAATELVRPDRVAAAAESLLATRRLVVADLPAGASGRAQLAALLARRGAGELVVAIERPASARAAQLVWAAIAGLDASGGRELTSATTDQRGMIAATDLAPTILAHLGLPVPGAMLGRRIVAGGRVSIPSLLALERRLRAIPGRRPAALAVLLAACALLLGLAALVAGARGRSWALRVAGLALLWLPAAALLPAALEPPPLAEYGLLAALCLGLAFVSDRALVWPRAPIAPALAATGAITIDALARTGLLLRALPGPDPLGGVRFHGIGNELKSALAVMVLVAVASALHPLPSRRRSAGAFVLAGAMLALVEGATRIGAGVGGAILVSVSFALAAAHALGLDRRAVVLVLAAPVAAVAALAGIDLLSAGAGGHFSESVLHARSGTDLWHVVVRRYSGAWRELADAPMAAATALALAACAVAAARPHRVLGSLAAERLWRSALLGAIAAGLAGSLVEDSGPLLLLVALFTLGCAGVYARGRPCEARSRITQPRSALVAYSATATPTTAVLGGSEGIA